MQKCSTTTYCHSHILRLGVVKEFRGIEINIGKVQTCAAIKDVPVCCGSITPTAQRNAAACCMLCGCDAFSHHRMGVKSQEFAHKSDAHSPSEDFLSSRLVAVPILVNVQRAEELTNATHSAAGGASKCKRERDWIGGVLIRK